MLSRSTKPLAEPAPTARASAHQSPRTEPFRALGYRLALLLGALLFLSGAAAAPGDVTVVVHPFDSQDVLLGVALADEVANSLHDRATVLGPDVAPGAIPPLIAEGGFISLSRIIGAQEFSGAVGADMLRGGVGVDIAITGSVEQRDSGYTLLLAIAHPGGLRTAEFEAPTDRPERLAVLAGALVDGVIDRQVPGAPPGEPTPYEPPSLTGSFEDAYGAYVRAVALVGAGLLEDALLELKEIEGAEGAPPRAAALREDLLSILEQPAEPAGLEPAELEPARLARRAILAVSAPDLEAAYGAELFRAFGEATALPVADAWRGALAASVNDRAGALEALSRAAEGYAYGEVVYASFLRSRGDASDDLGMADLIAAGAESGSAALLGASVVANLAGDDAKEEAALLALSRASPFLTYPLEQLSYLYFDRDDARSAAEVLTVATDLAPDSSLYWTNLGWARYLLGALEQSEAASREGLALDGTQSVAAYNLGLVLAVTGRLEEAMTAYEQALRVDPEVNDEAVVDLENARQLYPGQPGVDYALAVLYEAEGRRSDARAAFRRYLRLAGEDAPARLVERAEERLAALEAPLPPLEVSGELTLNLGARGPEAEPFHPGDPLHPTFELYTSGEELPASVDVTATLLPGGGEPASAAAAPSEPLAESSVTVEIPSGAVGYVVNELELNLPLDLASGDYRLEVVADGGEEQRVELSTTLSVQGEPQALRRLIGRGLVMTSFQHGGALYSARDLEAPGDLPDILLAELAASATAAEEALPEITSGRFEGLSGGELFTTSTKEDIADFLEYVLGSDSRDVRFAFVDAYAQWAIDGAPGPQR